MSARNPIAAALRSAMLQPKTIKARKGRGSYIRKRTQDYANRLLGTGSSPALN